MITAKEAKELTEKSISADERLDTIEKGIKTSAMAGYYNFLSELSLFGSSDKEIIKTFRALREKGYNVAFYNEKISVEWNI